MLRVIVDETPSLQLEIEREAAAYKPGHLGHLGIADALDAFRTTQRAYRYPSVCRALKIKLDALHPALKRRPGVQLSDWHLFGDILVSKLRHDRTNLPANIVCLLSTKLGIPVEDRLTMIDLSRLPDISHLFIDQSQDLLVVSTRDGPQPKLHFLDLQDGSTHEKAAARPDGSITVQMSWIFPHAIFLCGDWLLVKEGQHSAYRTNNVFLYHWPSGTKKQVRLSLEIIPSCR